MLSQLVRWTILAIDSRDAIVEFHYPFLVAITHQIASSAGWRAEWRMAIAAGVEGLKKAITTFDAAKGSPTLIGFARKSVIGTLLRWWKLESQYTAVTRPIKQVEPGTEKTREPIPVREIVEGLREEGWKIAENAQTARPYGVLGIMERIPAKGQAAESGAGICSRFAAQSGGRRGRGR